MIASTNAPSTATTARTFRAIGTTATVVVEEAGAAGGAEEILRDEIQAIDRACSRFRPDSELEHVHTNAGRTVRVSSLLFEALEIALAVAERTAGAVDPTVGNAMSDLGYDGDFDHIEDRPLPSALGPVAGFSHIHLDRRSKTVRIPKGVLLDLGSSAKAFVVDRSAARIAEDLGVGVLVCVGGDIRVAGSPPQGGWAVGIAVDSSHTVDEVDQVVAIRSGGLASSSPGVRTWLMGNERVHHIVDPATGRCAEQYWKLVSAVGSSCVEANASSTAALVWGRYAVDRLHSFGQAVRLVRHDDQVVCLGGWPEPADS